MLRQIFSEWLFLSLLSFVLISGTDAFEDKKETLQERIGRIKKTQKSASADDMEEIALIECVAEASGEKRAEACLDRSTLYGRTALMIFSREGWTEEVRTALLLGADVNASDRYGNTALILALANRNPDIAGMLLESGARVNVRGDEGWTPLMYAAYHGMGDMIRRLIRAGADTKPKNIAMQNALRLAVIRGGGGAVDALEPFAADADDHLDLAGYYGAASDYPRAFEHLEKAVSIDPSLAMAWHLRGLLKARAGDYDDAIGSLQNSIRLKPEQPEVLLALADCYRKKGDFESALDIAFRAMTKDPESSVWAGTAAEIYLFREGPGEARPWYERAFTLRQKEFERSPSGQGYEDLAHFALFAGRTGDAGRIALDGIVLNPSQTRLLLLLGHAMLVSDEQAEALVYYRKFIERAGQDSPSVIENSFLLLERRFPDRKNLIERLKAQLKYDR